MKTIRNFFAKYEKWLTPTALFGGFILDNFTLRRTDAFFENLLLILYFILLMGALFVWHYIDSKKQKSVATLEFQSILFLLIQFIFGGLFSALAVFYIKSSSFFSSWPFLIILFGGMIATEYFKKHFNRFLIQITTLYFLLFTYTIVLIPLVVRSVSQTIFIVSGIISLGLIFGYVYLYKKIIPHFFKKGNRAIYWMIGGVFVLINVFYVTNIIPPIPLALKESGVYQNIIRNNVEYQRTYFESSFSFTQFKRVYYVPAGSPVYFYSSVFAPIRFNQGIVHEWSKKNTKGDWVIVSNIPFRIQGGNERGYRGYTVSSQVTRGEWRVRVKTNTGQVLGGESFIVK